MPTATPPTDPRPDLLSRPTERELLDGLGRWLGAPEAEALWNRVCAYEGLRRPVIDVRELRIGAQALLYGTDGRAKISARCFAIRTSNFIALTKGRA